jgi:hypothetical protein
MGFVVTAAVADAVSDAAVPLVTDCDDPAAAAAALALLPEDVAFVELVETAEAPDDTDAAGLEPDVPVEVASGEELPDAVAVFGFAPATEFEFEVDDAADGLPVVCVAGRVWGPALAKPDFGECTELDCDDPAELDDEAELDEPESAEATAGMDAMAPPIPRATARAPTRPTESAPPDLATFIRGAPGPCVSTARLAALLLRRCRPPVDDPRCGSTRNSFVELICNPPPWQPRPVESQASKVCI